MGGLVFPYVLIAFSSILRLSGSTGDGNISRHLEWSPVRIEKRDLCSDPRCVCLFVSGLGTNITCRCSPQDKEPDLSVHSTPRELAILVIEGCREVSFQKPALKGRGYLSAVNISDVGSVQFEPHSVGSVNGRQNPLITIRQCRELVLHSEAFSSNIETPVSLTVADCQTVEVRALAFSRVHHVSLSGIPRLRLAPYAFRFPPTTDQISKLQGDITISDSVLINGLQSFTFPSSFRQLILQNVSIATIHPNATTALHVLRFTINASRIDTVAEQAFGESTHFDTLEIANTEVGNISPKAVRSAISNFALCNNSISNIHESGISITAARIVVKNNRIGKLRSGALHLREWNDLLIENNTFQLIERHAFYHIGEPKIPEGSSVAVQFVIRNNTILRADTGALVFSAKAASLELRDNYFWHTCECSLQLWAADLTQVTRRLQSSVEMRVIANDTDDALWLGSTLYRTSFCLLSGPEAKCSNREAKFLQMTAYSAAFCPKQKDIAECVAQMAVHGVDESTVPQLDISETPLSKDSFNSSIATPLGFSTKENFVLLLILVVVAAVVVTGIILGVFFARRRHNKRTGGSKNVGQDEKVTCSPLLSQGEKSLGSGVVTSGSISRLSIKEYRNYVEDIGPIYSEPSEGFGSLSPASVDETPPEIPAFPPQWTTRSSDSSYQRKRTIDRGTQTGDESNKPSVADQFTRDVLTALKDQLELSPTYSEAQDSLVPKKQDEPHPTREILNPRELYDTILAGDSGAKVTETEDLYCKPWVDSNSTVRSVNEKKPEETKATQKTVSSPTKSKTDTSNVPFYIRGSLPKWPPPPKPAASTTRFKTSSAVPKPKAVSSPGSTVTPSAAKDTKPPWRAAAKPGRNATTPTGKDTPLSKPEDTKSPKDPKPNETVEVSPSLVVADDYSDPKDMTLYKQVPEQAVYSQYSEISPKPFSFSFRKPLFPKDAAAAGPPPKPARLNISPPRDCTEPSCRSEPLYAEVSQK